MNKLVKRAVALVMAALIITGSFPAEAAFAKTLSPLHTTVTSTGKGDSQKVTYKLDLDKASVSDGRVAIVYDPEVLILESDSEKVKFSDSDLNKEYAEGEDTGVSYAFVNDSAKKVSGNVITLQFSVVKGLSEQNTSIKTVIFDLNNEEEAILTDEVLEDSVKVGTVKPKTPRLISLNQTLIGVNVKWEGDKNATGYIVYRSTLKDGTYVPVAYTNGTSYWDILVSNNRTYYYKVRAYRNEGRDTIYSDFSNVLGITVKKFFGLFS